MPALSRERVVEVAYDTLCRHGLAGVSMRRLAADLGVQAGALYHHVASKQDLLAEVAERILDEQAVSISATDPAQAAHDIRAALLPVRDGAEVVSFVRAYRPQGLGPLRRLADLFAQRLPDPQAGWAAETVIRYVLGFVAEEQNRAELVRAEIIPGEPEASEAFRFGLDAILRGLDGP